MSGASAGLDPRALERLRAMFGEMAASQQIAGAVMLIERHGVLGLFEALGQQDAARGVEMRTDAIFRLYSMTKPIVSVALMMLAEQGRVLLRDPVAEYLPEFAAAQVAVEHDGRVELVVPRRAMTVHDLLRHTAGMSYEFLAPASVRRRYLEADLSSRARSNAQQVSALAALPLAHEPGAVWEYSRATAVVGRLLEVVSGTTLGEHLRASVFEPLGMVDTGFVVPVAEQHRIAEPLPGPDRGMPLFDARAPARLESGGGGLLSTAADYARFLRMLGNGGTLDGQRLLGRKTVEFMTADHLGPIPRSPGVLAAGHGFGLGVAVKTALGEHTEPGSVGSYGWSGAAGTAFFVDPRVSMFALILTQAPDRFDEVRERFRLAVYAAIEWRAAMNTVLAYVALGANLGDRARTLNAAYTALAALERTQLTRRSSFYQSASQGAAGPDYLNAVAELATALGPAELLTQLQRIEIEAGRERSYRNAPRTLDLDLLLYGDQQIASPTLIVPHPRLHERAFVLRPLAEIAPTLAIPGRGPMAELLASVADQRVDKLVP